MRGLIALTCLLLPASLAADDEFLLRPVNSGATREVIFHISGAFGGFGDFRNAPGADGAYHIPLRYEGKPARELRAIVFSLECQIELVSVDLVADPKREVDLECRPLPKITLRGRVTSSLDPDATGVEALYLAEWGHPFFGIVDGPVTQFRLGAAKLGNSGSFELELPDFWMDRVTSERKSAYIELLLRDSRGNLAGILLPGEELSNGLGLKILPVYPAEIALHKRE